MWLAAEALRPGGGDRVTLVEGLDPGNGVRLQIRGYEIPRSRPLSDDVEAAARRPAAPRGAMSLRRPPKPRRRSSRNRSPTNLFRLLRGKSNLLFAGSRDGVEVYADALRAMCEDGGVSERVFPPITATSPRRSARMSRPACAMIPAQTHRGRHHDARARHRTSATSTRSPRSARVRRSPRCGNASVARAAEPVSPRCCASSPSRTRSGRAVVRSDRLHLDLVQSIAMVECLKDGWCEPPAVGGLHLSTLVHQIFAVICQSGGLRPATAWRLLCERGPLPHPSGATSSSNS